MESTGDKDGVASYDARGQMDDAEGNDDSEIGFVYAYDGALRAADETQGWKLHPSDSKKIGGIDLEGKAGSGAVVVQSSFDGKDWVTDSILTDRFENQPANTSAALYTTTANQLVNGCHYRVTVAWEARRKTGTHGPFSRLPSYEYKDVVEVYEFFIVNAQENAKAASDDAGYTVGEETRNTGMDNGYSGRDPIKRDDVHAGWSIGRFLISGYSGNPRFRQCDENAKSNPIFLKNVGDKVTLRFQLDQKDLDRLNGDADLSIARDEKGSDQELGVQTQDFGRGALTIRFTDYQHNQHVNTYTDYLAAAATTRADTMVRLFEEGDYTVALDYEVKDSSPLVWKIPRPARTSAYRMSFSFSVRNSNCMVYPIDVKTGSELTGRYTENGFRLDMAKSRYLDVNVVRKDLSDDGLDFRENQVASDLEEYTDEGIYEMTVSNSVTEARTTLAIYVGDDSLLKAYVRYGKDYGGKYTIEDLRGMEGDGYTIGADGRLNAPSRKEQREVDESAIMVDESMAEPTPEPTTADPTATAGEPASDTGESMRPATRVLAVLAALAALAVVAAFVVAIRRRRRGKTAKGAAASVPAGVSDGRDADGADGTDDGDDAGRIDGIGEDGTR